jgi:hypothetical protein
MIRSVPEMMKSQSWNAYVCPTCRLVFKFPNDSKDPGAVCPACQQILQIPEHKSATVPPISETTGMAEVRNRIRTPRQKNRSKETLSWEQESGPKQIPQGRSKRKQPTLLIFCTMLLCGLAAWHFWTQQHRSPASNEPAIDAQSITPPPPTKTATNTPDPDAGLLEINAALLTEAEELARKFLSAQTVEELRGLIRNPDVNIPRIMKLHPDGKIDMGGLLTFNPADEFMKSGEFISVVVSTKNYDERTMVFTETADGIRVDWESWVGWCEMGWEDFMATKPTTGTLFRVKLNDTNYYNFDFSDEAKWKSYTLLSHDEKHQIYGYVELGSPIATAIGEALEPGDRFFTLSLKFPENAESNNQVIIERVISNGWVAPAPPPP